MRNTFSRLSKKALRIWALMMFLATGSCLGSVYTLQIFCFPPGSKPHEGDWQYETMIIVLSDERPLTSKSKKVVKIRIHDQNKTIFLNENFEFNCASIKANVLWNEFEQISIELFEEGNKFAKDKYNEQLMGSGPKRLIELMYQYDHDEKRFKRKTR